MGKCIHANGYELRMWKKLIWMHDHIRSKITCCWLTAKVNCCTFFEIIFTRFYYIVGHEDSNLRKHEIGKSRKLVKVRNWQKYEMCKSTKVLKSQSSVDRTPKFGMIKKVSLAWFNCDISKFFQSSTMKQQNYSSSKISYDCKYYIPQVYLAHSNYLHSAFTRE